MPPKGQIMCGIVARIGRNNEIIQNTLLHRGPDQQNVFSFESLIVEFSRLAITGGRSGNSPVWSDDKRWVGFLNGEVYNFHELIKSYGLTFSLSDTQVLVNGISKNGIRFLDNIRGMFAGIILDTLEKKVYIFRDPMGEKPLFINIESDLITLSSEFSSLMKLLSRPLAINSAAVASYFRFGYAEEPETFDLHVNAIEKGVVFSINLLDLTIREEFILDGYSVDETKLSLQDILSQIYDQILYTEVDSALALSSGIDSTSLLVAKAKRDRQGFQPIVVSFQNSPKISEAKLADASSKLLDLKSLFIELDLRNPIDDIFLLSKINDQPHADPSGVAYLNIFRQAHESNKKIVFLGHGPDEFFWGYEWLNKSLQKKKFLHPRTPDASLFWETPGLAKRLAGTLAANENKNRRMGSRDRYLDSQDPWSNTMAHLTHSYLTHNALRQSDRLAMHFSLEPRTPYSDSRLYGWAQNNCPRSPKATFDKVQFRSSLDLGPLENVRNRKKIGFRSDFHTWFSSPNIEDLFKASLESVMNCNLPWKTDLRALNLNAQEKYRIMMFGLWLG